MTYGRLWMVGALILSAGLALPSFAGANESFGQATAVPFDTCKPEAGVTFRAADGVRLDAAAMEALLVGNTILSVDRYGTFAIYYPEQGRAIGWMPKEKAKGYSWSAGTVAFEGGKYCRTWAEWTSGKTVNCWNIDQGPDHEGSAGFYFTCENGVPDGEVHVVLPGNAFEIRWSGQGAKSGTLTQDDAAAQAAYDRYFGAYVNK